MLKKFFVCPETGKPIVEREFVVCPHCGEPIVEKERIQEGVDGDMNFCKNCGKEIASTLTKELAEKS